MNGTGTSSNPYQITTIAEFRSMSDNTAYYKLMNDIDASYYNGGVWTAVTIKFRKFDGNGHKIRNINYNSDSYTPIEITCSNVAITSMHDVTFENFTCVSGSGTSHSVIRAYTANRDYYFNCYNCVFNIDFTGINGNDMFHCYYAIFRNCTFNIKGNYTGGNILVARPSAYGTESVLSCAFYVDLTIYGGTGGALIKGANTDWNCYISKTFVRGKITVTNEATQTTRGYIYMGTATNSYFAIEFNNVNSIYSHGYGGRGCFYDNTIKGSTTVYKYHSGTGDVDFHALTTAQCKNADYLQSIGFPVRWQT